MPLASTVFATARTLLNDDANTLFTDTVLLPKLVQAFRELQTKLKLAAAPVMRKESATNIASGILTLPVIADLLEPIRLWEKAQADPVTSYIQMTESDPLPLFAQTTSLIYWQWYEQAINFIGSTNSRTVKVQYWRSLTEPSGSGSDLVFNSGELYLAPRTAALAAGSLGEEKVYTIMSDLSEKSLNDVILANRGRIPILDRP